MSEPKKPSALGDLINVITTGAASLTAGKKKKPDQGAESEPPITEPTDITSEPRPLIDELEDPLHIDEQDQEQPGTPAKKGMTTKKKVALLAVVVCAGVLAQNGFFMPDNQAINPPAEQTANATTQSSDDLPAMPQLPDSGLSSEPASPLGGGSQADADVGQTLDQLDLDGPFQKPLANPDQNKVTSEATPPPGDGFGFPVAPSEMTPPPLEVSKAPSLETPAGDIVSPFGGSTEAVPAPVQTPTPADPSNVFGSIPTTPAAMPIAAEPPAEKRDPVLGSTSAKNPDSGDQPSQNNGMVNVKEMEAQLAKKDGEIKSLKAQLAAKQAPKSQSAKPAAAHIPKHEPVVAQRPSPRVTTPVAKVAPRPKLCVKAVAPPARNCPTCVAHAFVVDTGAESMVGQGDFLAGYRVSITGDRLDLQNSDGHVVHKFWSQPNGCPSI